MLFAIIASDHPNSMESRIKARPNHLQRLQELKAAGKLILAGPFPKTAMPDAMGAGVTGSLIVAEFDSQQAAQAWADADPYQQSGVYDSVEVKPFIQVLP